MGKTKNTKQVTIDDMEPVKKKPAKKQSSKKTKKNELNITSVLTGVALLAEALVELAVVAHCGVNEFELALAESLENIKHEVDLLE